MSDDTPPEGESEPGYYAPEPETAPEAGYIDDSGHINHGPPPEPPQHDLYDEPDPEIAEDPELAELDELIRTNPQQDEYGAPVAQQDEYGQPTPPAAPSPFEIAPKSSKATPALIFGILSLVICPGFLSVPALILARGAKAEISANPGMRGGGQAQAGFILGIISLALFALYMVLFAVGAIADS